MMSVIFSAADEISYLEEEVEGLRAALRNIVDCYDAASELHTSWDVCAATLADKARKALLS
jgi:hypothetical protein